MRIALLAPPGVQSLDIVGPAEVFGEAARRLGDPSAYTVQVIAGSAEPVLGTGGLRFLADRHIFQADEPIDTLLVGGDPTFETIDPATCSGYDGGPARSVDSDLSVRVSFCSRQPAYSRESV